MDGTEYWVVNGKVDVDPFSNPQINTPEALMQRSGGVHVKTGHKGTVVRWAMFASNWASLYYVAETLSGLRGPYTFEFFLSGWFSQTVQDPTEAYLRLHDLIVKSDIHLRQKTFVKAMETDNLGTVSNLIGETLVGGRADPETCVDCVYDPSTGRFVVERIGTSSSLAKLYGMSPDSFPCLTGHSYDTIVSQAYKQSLKTEQVVYDHVMAVFPVNDTVNKWMGYQRAIVPYSFGDGRKGVSVVTDFADVEITLP
ncbi:hypothetical protein [Anderseniella sp. Alg231-50]|uniref:hypothetical protein n=1 Tax=Anderseniella sp. Alg231-50 TaxID=1922226 RepID=UPI000D55CC20